MAFGRPKNDRDGASHLSMFTVHPRKVSDEDWRPSTTAATPPTSPSGHPRVGLALVPDLRTVNGSQSWKRLATGSGRGLFPVGERQRLAFLGNAQSRPIRRFRLKRDV
jgi:hypothetical protein